MNKKYQNIKYLFFLLDLLKIFTVFQYDIIF